VKSVTIVADDKVGLLADISYILAKAKINIDSVTVDVIGGKAIISLGLSDAVKGKGVLEAASYKVEDVNSVVVKLPDKPDELSKITAMLTKDGVKVENVRTLSKDEGNTILAITVDKPKRAIGVLKNYLIINEAPY